MGGEELKPPNAKRRPRKAAVSAEARECERLTISELVNFLRGLWLRHYILFTGLANEADRLAMARLGRFLDALKEIRR
jgi:hypothetical protein